MEKKLKILLWIVGGIAVFWAAWGLVMAFVPCSMPTVSFANRGLFGDSFGALNTLFTGVALAAVLYGVYVQHEETQKSHRDANEREVQRLEHEMESRFFRMTDALRQIVYSMRFNHNQKREGREVFTAYAGVILQKNAGEPPEKLIANYEDLFQSQEPSLGSYFRFFYRTVLYIHEAEIANKEDYTDLIRAELSGTEVIILALNCLTQEGEKFKPLVERYHLLQHLPGHYPGYPRSFFESRFDPSAFV